MLDTLTLYRIYESRMLLSRFTAKRNKPDIPDFAEGDVFLCNSHYNRPQRKWVASVYSTGIGTVNVHRDGDEPIV